MTILSVKTLKKMSDLAKIEIDLDHSEKMRADLICNLKFIDQIQKIDTTDVEPMSNVHDIDPYLRSDISIRNNSEELLRTAPNIKNGQYQIPPLVDPSILE